MSALSWGPAGAWIVLAVVVARRARPLPARRQAALGLGRTSAVVPAPVRTRAAAPRTRPRRAAAVVTAFAAAGIAVSAGLRVLLCALAVLALLDRRRRCRRRCPARGPLVMAALELHSLLTLAIEGGAGIREGLDLAERWLTEPVRAEVRGVLDAADRGGNLADALDEAGSRLGGQLRPLFALLASGSRHGVPLESGLRVLGVDLRQQRRRELESRARRIPALLLGPLLVGVLPSFVLLAIVPLLVGMLGQLQFPA